MEARSAPFDGVRLVIGRAMQIPRSDESLLEAARVLTTKLARDRSPVLVIDHDPNQQWRTARTLTLAGHRVIGTSSVEGALALLSECKVDLVLVAETMPGINGWNLAQLIKEAQPNVPVVVLIDAKSSGLAKPRAISR